MFQRYKNAKEFFSAPPCLNTYFRSGKISVNHDAGTYDIYSLTTLNNLLTKKIINQETPTLRFLIDVQGVAWFAEETLPGIKAPKHYQMTGKNINEAFCITAGNIKFKNKKYCTLKNISHRSGDFHPSFHSLRLFLAFLILHESSLPFKLPLILTIKEFNQQGDLVFKHRWRKSKMRKWVYSFSEQTAYKKLLEQQPMSVKKVTYGALNYTPQA
ncbi:MAG: hypothetical protein BGO90_05680 [Legionella sp. 40-6]|nr:hypothetical protein [Legionella sp.]OJY33156.1 MAG: hypothetical protein BGO90_05680 [Legionella sp. 40-6]